MLWSDPPDNADLPPDLRRAWARLRRAGYLLAVLAPLIVLLAGWPP